MGHTQRASMMSVCIRGSNNCFNCGPRCLECSLLMGVGLSSRLGYVGGRWIRSNSSYFNKYLDFKRN